MSHSEDDQVQSPGGSKILRHSEPSEWASAHGGESIEEITGHIEAHLGPVKSVFHEIVSDTVHIDVHFVEPTADFPVIRLVTSGMSDLPMSIPDGVEAPPYLELMISLPPNWKLNDEAFQDERWYWPVRLLKGLARLPHKYSTWLGWGHTIPNGDPAEPYAPGLPFTGAIILPSVSAPADFHRLKASGDREVQLLAVVPLYPGEMDLKLRSGTDKLLDRLGAKNLSDVVAIDRPDVSKRRFWFFG